MKKGKFYLKRIDKLILVFLAVIVFSLLGFVFSRIGFHNYDEKEITYQESKDIDYQVYLQPNDFFEEAYLPKNQTYITSLIDYIHIDFDYNFDLSEAMSGIYSYYVKAVVEANQENSDSNYFTREYILSDTFTESYENQSSLHIANSLNVDYPTYNNLLINFRNEYGINMDGNLRVVLVISNTIKSLEENKDILKETELELNIPLTTLTVEVPIEIDNDTDDGVLTNYKINKEGVFYFIAKRLGVLSYFVAFLFVLYLIYLSILSVKMESVYHKKLRKILKVYDGVIVNLKAMPSIDQSKILSVSTFEELIDAHSEVRNPINYIDQKDGAVFLLMSDGYNYYYKLKRELFSKKAKE